MSKGEGEEVSWVGELRLGWTWLETFTAYRSLLSACFFPFPHSPFPFSPFVPPCSPFPFCLCSLVASVASERQSNRNTQETVRVL